MEMKAFDDFEASVLSSMNEDMDRLVAQETERIREKNPDADESRVRASARICANRLWVLDVLRRYDEWSRC